MNVGIGVAASQAPLCYMGIQAYSITSTFSRLAKVIYLSWLHKIIYIYDLFFFAWWQQFIIMLSYFVSSSQIVFCHQAKCISVIKPNVLVSSSQIFSCHQAKYFTHGGIHFSEALPHTPLWLWKPRLDNCESHAPRKYYVFCL